MNNITIDYEAINNEINQAYKQLENDLNELTNKMLEENKKNFMNTQENSYFTDKELKVNNILKHNYKDEKYNKDFRTFAILKEFVNTRNNDYKFYENYIYLDKYWEWCQPDIEECTPSIIDLNDYYLRVIYDEIEMNIISNDIDDIVEYLLRKLYNCKSSNEYDYNFLFNNLDKEQFIKDTTSQILGLIYIDGELIEVTGR